MDPDYEYPRETQEFVYFKEILIEGLPPVLPLEYSLVRGLARPVLWSAVVVHNSRFAFFLDGTLPPGEYQVFVRVPTASEQSVIEAGRIRLT